MSISGLRERASKLREFANKLNEKADLLEERASEVDEMLSDLDFGSLGFNAEGEEEENGRQQRQVRNTQGRRGRPKGSDKKSEAVASASEDAPRRRGRPKGSKNKSGRHHEGSLKSLILAELKKKPNGMNLTDIVKACLEAGYKSESEKFANIVYQNLYSLMKQENAVEKDAETKKYKLTQAA